MVSIGYLHIRRDPRKIKKLYAYMAAAKMEGAELFYFTPGRVNLQRNTIRGLTYHCGAWEERNYPFPDVIYNDSFPDGERGMAIMDRLYDKIPVTSHSIGDKWTVYQRILKGKKYVKNLITSNVAKDAARVIDSVQAYRQVVIKPCSGRQGIGVARVSKTSSDEEIDSYTVTSNSVETAYTIDGLISFLNERISTEEHLIQPFVDCRTKSGNAYDFRLHVQKDRSGKWVLTAIYPRIAPGSSITPNLSSGGITMMPKHFFQMEFAEDALDVCKELHVFAIQFAAHLDTLYEEPLDELGIDIGLDQQRNIWVFEVNWRPGPPPIWNVELDVARNSIGYAMYLSERKSGNASKAFS